MLALQPFFELSSEPLLTLTGRQGWMIVMASLERQPSVAVLSMLPLRNGCLPAR